MENPALNRFTAVIDMRNGPVQNDVGRIVQKPILIQTRKGNGLTAQVLIFLVFFFFHPCSFNLCSRISNFVKASAFLLCSLAMISGFAFCINRSLLSFASTDFKNPCK